MDYLSASKSYGNLVSRLIVEELYRNDVITYAVCPGARMVPLLDAISEHQKAQIHYFNDERAAAFWAQAHARVTGVPVVLLVTSGTAVANLLPGVIEAHYSSLPLLVITSDRPWELHNAKANQTIKQNDIFKEYSKLTIDLPAIEDKLFPESLLSNIDQLVYSAKSLPSGPCHLNIAFRKPFSTDDFNLSLLDSAESKLIEKWFLSKQQFKTHTITFPSPAASEVEAIKELIAKSKKPLIVTGPLKPYYSNPAILNLAEKIQAPIFADLDSGLRSLQSKQVCSYYNLFLKELDLKPDLVLYFGDRIISEKLKAYLQACDTQQILFTDYHYRLDAIENDYLNFNKQVFCRYDQMAKALEYSIPAKETSNLFEKCRALESAAIDSFQSLMQSFNEASSLASIVNQAKENSIIYHSSSLLFRELEYFISPKNAKILSNRGAVGIDGVIASALGAASANTNKTYLLIGDQAFLHDLNSLALIKEQNLQIFIINNQGGAVFNLLPEDNLHSNLVNSHNVNFENLISGFGINYQRSENLQDLQRRIEEINGQNLPSITEVVTDGSDSAKFFSSL